MTLNYAHQYRDHILDDIMPFWDSKCIDHEYGGYLTCFDRTGNLTDDKKYIWFQGRQLYVYSFLYNNLSKRETWLEFAKHGYKFLIDKAYAGQGRWNYLLDRKGNVLQGTNSIYSDFHVIHGIAEYLKAIDFKDEEGLNLLSLSYDVLEKNMFDPFFKDIYENEWSPTYIWHDMYLTCLATADACTDILGATRTNKLVDECVHKILYWFAKDDYSTVFEMVSRDNKVNLESAKGRFVNPGHMLESMWFCLKVGHRRKDKRIIDRALQIVNWGNEIGEDREYGGLVSYTDAQGLEPVPLDWFAETNSLWHEKVWWPNSEALACYAWAYYLSDQRQYLEMFERQHSFCCEFFFDPDYGEWYERLFRNGEVKNDHKGTPWKCAFHLVRALVMVENLFREIEANKKKVGVPD